MNSLLQNGLLGMGGLGGLAPQPQGLLGNYYDPKAARMATLKNMLVMGGLGLAGDGWQGAARGAGLAALETPKQFRDMAMDAYQMDRQAKGDAREDEKWGMEKSRWDAVNSLVGGIDDPLVKAFPEQYAVAQFDAKYGKKNGPTYGMQGVPLVDQNGQFATYGQYSGDGGIYVSGQPIDALGLRPMDPRDLAERRASGAMEGKAPDAVIDYYVKTTRPQMEQAVEGIRAVNQARSMLDRGIQTGSLAEMQQSLRGLGQALGIPVDERVLSDTQAYQNFIGNIVIPRMAALGGNDSNEEMRYMRSLSGGDISQMPEALRVTFDYTEKLLRGRINSGRAQEKVALPILQLDAVPDPAPYGVPDAAVQELMADPSAQAIAEFNEAFGPGAAESILQGR